MNLKKKELNNNNKNYFFDYSGENKYLFITAREIILTVFIMNCHNTIIFGWKLKKRNSLRSSLIIWVVCLCATLVSKRSGRRNITLSHLAIW